MIRLSRLNGKSFVLNCDLIQTLESTPDTVITLRDGEKLMVREPVDEVIRLAVEFRKRLFENAPAAAVQESRWT